MRIVVFGGSAFSLINFRGHLIEAMVKAGHEVIALAPEVDPEISARLNTMGAAYLSIPLNRTGRGPISDLRSVWALHRLFRKLRPDLLLAYTVKPVIWGSIAARFAGVPARFAMITGRGTPLMAVKGNALRTLTTWLYRLGLAQARGVIFQNPDDLAFFEAEGMLGRHTPRTVVNGSGVDLTRFAEAPQPAGPPTFLFLGRMIRDKGIHDYLEACRRLSIQGLQARFLALGPLDPNPTALHADELAGACGAGGVEYLGEAEDVRPALARVHVLVLPSRGEGTPRSVLEAMAMGRAIITTDAPGCRETVEDGVNGLRVPVGDVEALVRAMADLAADPARMARLGREGRRIAEVKYEVGQVSAAVLAFMGLSEASPC